MSDAVTAVGGGNAAVLESLGRHAPGLWRPEVAFVRGDGALLYDADGKEYIDCLAGIGVASVGHGNRRLADAVAAQAARLVVCPQNLGNDVRARFLEELFAFVRPPLTRAFLSNSGAEANEAALKWARVATGRSRFVAVKRGFSGRTLGVLPLTWEPKYREPFQRGEPHVTFVTLGDEAELRSAVTEETAAVVMEPIQGESGIRPAPDGYLRLARELTRETGALLVLDEIQCGVGRTGTFLASEPAGVQADVVTLAKGLAGGVPIGATLMTEEVAAAMPAGGHGTTFGGNPLSAAAGLAVLAEIRERDLMRRATELGGRLMDGLRSLGDPRVVEVRGRGLMVGMELSVPVAPLVSALLREGVVTTSGGSHTVRFLPPLVIEAAQVDEVVARVGRALTSLG
ncbi:MAG TPA: aminotransferase class III-fold pyridoxal phosphate-dependent enzyme [Trueperaceae bacterium]|nr:aminotransferase class III-fold pyridoxal phosphate-dependent enzyme [Trueperaceae bacterium]